MPNTCQKPARTRIIACSLPLQAIQIRRKRLPYPFDISLPLKMLTRRLSGRERLGKVTGNLEDASRRLLCFLELLLHGGLLGFEGEDGGVAFREGVELALRFLGREGDEFGSHEIANGANVLFICDSGEDAVEEFQDVGAREGGIKRCVEGFVGALHGVRWSSVYDSKGK